MLKRSVLIVIVALLIVVGLRATDGPLTNFLNLRGRTDENGYLMMIAGVAGVTPGPLTSMSNLRARTDENGYLIVNCSTCGSGGSVTSVGWTGGIVSVANPTTTPAFTVAGTSGGVPYFASTSTWASSALLTANAVMLGGGAATAPKVVAGLGTSGQVLTSNGAGVAPTFQAGGIGGSITTTQVAFGSGVNTIAGSANLTWDGSTLHSGPAESTLDPLIQGYVPAGSLFSTYINSSANPPRPGIGVEAQAASAGVASVLAVYGAALLPAAAVSGLAYGVEGDVILGATGGHGYGLSGFGQISDGITASLLRTVYAFAPTLGSGSSLSELEQFWSDDLAGTATNAYYSWFDSRGVRRVKEDATFDSVGQAIEALYNPQFTKYTPGAANYERVVLGQWDGNVAEIGTETGGTGTLRGLSLIGASLTVPALATTGAATGKTVVCADTAGKLYRSTSGVACAN